jgi:hypothetical protein
VVVRAISVLSILVMDRQPDGEFFRLRPLDPVPSVGRDSEVVAGTKFDGGFVPFE